MVCRALALHELFLKVTVKTDLNLSSRGLYLQWKNFKQKLKVSVLSQYFFQAYTDNLCWHIVVIEEQRLKIIFKYSLHSSKLI